MIRAKPELLYGGVTMAPQDAAWDFDAIMPALRDPDRRVSPLKEVEKWSSSHADTILEVAAQGQIEKAWTQKVDALHQMARAQFQRTSTVLAEIKDATVRRREALRRRQSCQEALAVTSSTDSLLALAWTTWVAAHKLRLRDQTCSSICTGRSSITAGPTTL